MKDRRENNVKENIKQFYKNKSIRQKLYWGIFPVMILMSVAILVTTNVIFSHALITKEKNNIVSSCELLANQMTDFYNNIDTCSNMLTQDINRIYKEQSQKNQTQVSFIPVKNQLISAMNYERNCFSGIDSIIFIDNQYNVVVDGGNSNPEQEKICSELLAKMKETGPPQLQNLGLKERDYLQNPGDEEAVLTMGKRIINMENGKNIGYIFINIKESTFQHMLPEEGSTSYYFSDESADIIVRNELEDDARKEIDLKEVFKGESRGGQYEIKQNGRKYLLSMMLLEEYDWYLVSCISVWELKKDVYINMLTTIVISVLAIGAAGFCVVKISKILTFPLQELAEVMKMVQSGRLDIRCPVRNEDEVGMLSKGFNTMIQRLGELFFRIQEEQRKKSEYQLALSQSQIRPHFLYNSLDLIYVLCQIGEHEKAADTTKSLAEFYRACLSGGDEIITIRDELELTENYLKIQRERYSDFINFVIRGETEAEECLIPKMTLQPLVENAIYHGLKESGSGGTITIRVIYDKEIYIHVEDDGIGMEESYAERLLEMKVASKQGGFGMKNVDERIKLYYGSKYGLSIKSIPGSGTCVTICIPPCREKIERGIEL